MIRVKITHTLSWNLPMGMVGNETSLLKLAKTGRAEEVSRKKFQEAWVSPRNTRKYRAT